MSLGPFLSQSISSLGFFPTEASFIFLETWPILLHFLVPKEGRRTLLMDQAQESQENLLAIMGTLTSMYYISIPVSGGWFSHFRLLRMCSTWTERVWLRKNWRKGKPGKRMIATVLTSIFCVLFMKTFLFPNYICIYFIYICMFIYFLICSFFLLLRFYLFIYLLIN